MITDQMKPVFQILARKIIPTTITLALMTALTACGGGGSSSNELPNAPTLSLSLTAVKSLNFSWDDVNGETHYKLFENTDGISGFLKIESLPENSTTHTQLVPLFQRANAQYILEACNADGCSESNTVSINSSMEQAIGYFKASNTGPSDSFGSKMAISSDGKTMAIASRSEDSNATGPHDVGNSSFSIQQNNDAENSGAVYVYKRSNIGIWKLRSYIKASNSEMGDAFGSSLALSGDGNTLAIGATNEDSNATGIDNTQTNNDALNSGAVYIFKPDNFGTWNQTAYVKSSNTEASDSFGQSVSLSGNGQTLAVGASSEESNSTGINGDQTNNSSEYSGATYIFVLDSSNSWSQQAYIKASNTDERDFFGGAVTLSSDGNTLAVSASGEESNAHGINGDQNDNTESGAGAVYLFTRNAIGAWFQQAYIKASNSEGINNGFEAGDVFGSSLDLSADGKTLAVGSHEDGNASGINGDQTNNDADHSGAVYIFTLDNTNNWSQQAYIKASNTEAEDIFSSSLALSADGNILVVGASGEDSADAGINGDQSNNNSERAGAVFTFKRTGTDWFQQSYLKASNTDSGSDAFGIAIALSSDGNTLAVGATGEDSNATGIGGNQTNADALSSGAVYLF